MKVRKLSAVLLAGAAGSTLLLSATAAGAAVAGPHGLASGHAASKAGSAHTALPACLACPLAATRSGAPAVAGHRRSRTRHG
jgi:hypothetical protein